MNPRPRPVRGAANPERCAACLEAGLVSHLEVGQPPSDHQLIPSTDHFGAALSDIVRCPACGHMQLAHLPSTAALLEDYSAAASDDYLVEEAGQRRTARVALAMIERHTPPGSMLDVGCWLGFLLDEARHRGWTPVGLEPSRFAARHARERLGLEVRTTDLFTASLAARSFDAIVLADVLEHLVDPGAGLRRVSELARPGAVLYLALPDAGSRTARALGRRWWSVIPTHVQYFTRRSLFTLLTRCGWHVLEQATAPKSFTVRYYLARLGGYSQPLGRSLVALADAVNLADRVWTPDFRDRMAVVARWPDG